MIDLNLTDLFLTGMTTYGPLLFGLALLLSPLGLPVPAGLLVLAAGAFARQGFMDWPVAAAVGLVGTVLGDVGSYGLGCFAGDWVQHDVVLPCMEGAIRTGIESAKRILADCGIKDRKG